MKQNVDFSAFTAKTKQAWLEKAQQDLKGKPIAGLNWDVEPDISLESFYHASDQHQLGASPKIHKPNNTWLIGEQFLVEDDFKSSNQIALKALEGGVNALYFKLEQSVTADQLSMLLDKIELGFITTYFETNYYEDPTSLAAIRQCLAGHQGGIFLSHSEDPFTPLTKATIQAETETLKWFKVSSSVQSYTKQVAEVIYKGNNLLKFAEKQSLPLEQVCTQVQFEFHIGSSILPEIAKLRAFRMLWATVLEGYGVRNVCSITGRNQLTHENTDQYSNMIRTALQALTAVIGGVDLLILTPADGGSGTAFTRQIARNIQHILQLEAYLGRVIDPVAGSYYLEEMTRAFGEKAWKQFLELEYGGGS